MIYSSNETSNITEMRPMEMFLPTLRPNQPAWQATICISATQTMTSVQGCLMNVP